MERNPDLSDVEPIKSVDVVGLNSTVLEKLSEDNSRAIGHVTMIDIENEALKTVKQCCYRHLDLYSIFRSSKSGFHVIDYRIRCIAEIKALLERMTVVDEQFIKQGYKNGYWTLRVTNKGHKSAPEYIGTFLGTDMMPQRTIRDVAVSKPHIDIHKEQDTFTDVQNQLKTFRQFGDSAEIVKYGTRPNNHSLKGDSHGQ